MIVDAIGPLSGRMRALLLGLVATALAGCSSAGSPRLELMPAPAVFADGADAPMPQGLPPVNPVDYGLLYATDRKPAEPGTGEPFYRNESGVVLRLGRARIRAGEDMSWEALRAVSLSSERDRRYPMAVVSVEETSVLESTYSFMTRKPEGTALADPNGSRFAALVDEQLAASGVDEVFVFVHGYRVVFTNPVLVSAQLWHFLGYRGAFIAYAWPSTPRGLAYLSDIETARSMARKFRLFLTFLADSTRVRRIHIIGYSAGSRLVVRALEQLALQYDEVSEAELHQRLRIGTVVLTAADMSREGFGTAVLDGVLTVPERTIVYMSSNDQALALSRRLFKRERLGEVWTDQLPPRQRRSMRARADLELIDVTGAPGTTTGSGHAYFRDSPWVSSDLLAALGDGLGAADRGLVHDDERLVWTFPPDYVERAQRARMSLR